MQRFLVLFFLLGASCLLAPRPALAVVVPSIAIPTVPVGNVGNRAANTNGLGAVNYYYEIGTTEVTNAQYAAFLNAKAATDPLALHNEFMDSHPRGGITRTGSDGNYTYTTKPNMAEKPVNFVTWYSSIRFANWLHNGQGAGDTETGSYTLLGGTPTPSNGNLITRNSGWTWVLPTLNEWYKAAYHQPASLGGDSDDYWSYPTASNSVPTRATANAVGDISNPGANVANWGGGAYWNTAPAYPGGDPTTVGSAGPLSNSFYGTADQGGNIWEWTEQSIGGSFRGLMGGSFFGDSLYGNNDPSELSGGSYGEPWNYFDDRFGFRVAIVPEPSTAVLGIVGCALMWVLRRRFK